MSCYCTCWYGYRVLIFVEQKQKTMKHVIFYKATSGYWFAQFPIKGEGKPRRMACGTTDQDLKNAIERYTKKGYSYTIN